MRLRRFTAEEITDQRSRQPLIRDHAVFNGMAEIDERGPCRGSHNKFQRVRYRDPLGWFALIRRTRILREMVAYEVQFQSMPGKNLSSNTFFFPQHTQKK